MIKTERLIALFDILGFAGRLKTIPLNELQRSLRNFTRMIRFESLSNIGPYTKNLDLDNVEVARFVFDSLLLVSNELSASASIQNFLLAVISLLEIGFRNLLPFRGSIAKGSVFVDDENGLIMSDQLGELRDGEQLQQWSGCFVHSSAESSIAAAVFGEDGIDRYRSHPQAEHPIFWYNIPVKPACPQPYRRWCLNWGYLSDRPSLHRGLEYLRSDPPKYENTSKFLRWLETLPNKSREVPPPAPAGVFTRHIIMRGATKVVLVDRNGHRTTLPPGTVDLTACDPQKNESSRWQFPIQ